MKKWNHALGTGMDDAKSSRKVVLEWQITILISFFVKINLCDSRCWREANDRKTHEKTHFEQKMSKKDRTGIFWLLLVIFAGVKLSNFCYIGRSLMVNWISWTYILWNMHCNLWFNWFRSCQNRSVRWSVSEISGAKSLLEPASKKSRLMRTLRSL